MKKNYNDKNSEFYSKGVLKLQRSCIILSNWVLQITLKVMLFCAENVAKLRMNTKNANYFLLSEFYEASVLSILQNKK